jgi:hypothetical protein
MNLDHPSDFNRASTLALQLGQSHVAAGQKKLSSDALVALVASKLCALGHGMAYRRFHQEILNRAYGLPFTNATKLRWAKTRGI